MFVSVCNQDSHTLPVSSGVPQGSVPGPILFLVYVNHLAHGLSCKWFTYADDFKLCWSYARQDLGSPSYELQTDLNCINRRSVSWNLKLNPGKCVVMRFGAGLGVSGVGDELSGYFLGEGNLRLVKYHRDLGS